MISKAHKITIFDAKSKSFFPEQKKLGFLDKKRFFSKLKFARERYNSLCLRANVRSSDDLMNRFLLAKLSLSQAKLVNCIYVCTEC